MKVIKDINYSTENKLDIYLPDSNEFDTVIHIHGGGLEGGDKAHDGIDVFGPYLAERNIAVISIEYSLYPNAKYPQYIEDSAEAISWIFKNINTYGKCNNFYVLGTSAGGYISMMLCFNQDFLKKYGIDNSMISGYIHNAGQPTCHFNLLRERGFDSRRVMVDETAPLYYVGIEKEYPPMLFLVSDNDIQNRYEQIILMVSTLKHFGFSDDTVSLEVIHGVHCAQNEMLDENNDSVLGKLVYKFITK